MFVSPLQAGSLRQCNHSIIVKFLKGNQSIPDLSYSINILSTSCLWKEAHVDPKKAKRFQGTQDRRLLDASLVLKRVGVGV